MRRALPLWLIAAVWIGPLAAHELRPAFLSLKQTGSETYDVVFKVPAGGESMRAGLAPVLPPECVADAPARWSSTTDAAIERRSVRCSGGLSGRSITVAHLAAASAEVLLRLEGLDGRAQTVRLTPDAPSFAVQAVPSRWRVATTFLRFGFDHILLGIDHLLFVLGLLLIVPDRWMLIRTITSFTLAHSLTLAAATLGYASAPVPPVEAAIALSILFLGPEIVRYRRGGTSLTIRQPWIVAFAFGLLHGFGFASGLATIGIPPGEIPLALLCFNVGVEAGQLGFVALMLLVARSFRSFGIRWPRILELAPAYVVGSSGAFWMIERTVAMMLR